MGIKLTVTTQKGRTVNLHIFCSRTELFEELHCLPNSREMSLIPPGEENGHAQFTI